MSSTLWVVVVGSKMFLWCWGQNWNLLPQLGHKTWGWFVLLNKKLTLFCALYKIHVLSTSCHSRGSTYFLFSICLSSFVDQYECRDFWNVNTCIKVDWPYYCYCICICTHWNHNMDKSSIDWQTVEVQWHKVSWTSSYQRP